MIGDRAGRKVSKMTYLHGRRIKFGGGKLLFSLQSMYLSSMMFLNKVNVFFDMAILRNGVDACLRYMAKFYNAFRKKRNNLTLIITGSLKQSKSKIQKNDIKILLYF